MGSTCHRPRSQPRMATLLHRVHSTSSRSRCPPCPSGEPLSAMHTLDWVPYLHGSGLCDQAVDTASVSGRAPTVPPTPGSVIIGWREVPPQVSSSVICLLRLKIPSMLTSRGSCTVAGWSGIFVLGAVARTTLLTLHLAFDGPQQLTARTGLFQGGCSCDLKLEGWLVVVILILVRRQDVPHVHEDALEEPACTPAATQLLLCHT